MACMLPAVNARLGSTRRVLEARYRETDATRRLPTTAMTTKLTLPTKFIEGATEVQQLIIGKQVLKP